MKWTEELRAFWSRPTLQEANRELVIVPGPEVPDLLTLDGLFSAVGYAPGKKTQVRGADIRGLRVLDFGCGTGRLTFELLDRGAVVIAADVSPSMIEHARGAFKRKYRNVHPTFILGTYEEGFVVTDGYTLPVSDEFFDLAISALTFQHMPSREMIASNLREIRRVLRPGGEFILQIGKGGTRNPQAVGFEGFRLDYEEWIQLAAEAGFFWGQTKKTECSPFIIARLWKI